MRAALGQGGVPTSSTASPASSSLFGALVAFTLGCGTTAFAGGFALSEHDAAASGRMGTAVAHRASPSAVHYNPAGLAGLDGAAARAGMTAIAPSATAGLPGERTEEASGGWKTPPHAYLAYGAGDLSLGLGFNAPFGGGLRWADDWRGRYELIELSLQVLAGHAALAYRLSPELSLGAGLSLYGMSVKLDRRLDFVDREGTALLAGSGGGLGGSFGVSWTPDSAVRLGLTGKLPVQTTLRGRAHFGGVPPAFGEMLVDQPITTRLTLPAKLALGMELQLAPVKLFAEVELTFWSSFQRFAIDFEDERTPDVNQPRNWGNAFTARLGAERAIGDTVLRAGAMIDGAASPAETLSPSQPDSTRLGFSLGAGRGFDRLRVDLAYQYIRFLPRRSEGEAFPAEYGAWAHLLAVSLGWGEG